MLFIQALPIAATIALEMIGPIPGTVITLRQLSSLFATVSISSVAVSIRSSSRRHSLLRSTTMRTMRGGPRSQGIQFPLEPSRRLLGGHRVAALVGRWETLTRKV
jgi:hypothetical protein